MKRLLATVAVALAVAAPAYGYYNDGGSGGNRPDCTDANVGDWWGSMECLRDPFYGQTEWQWEG